MIPVPAGIHARPPPPENVNRDTTNYDHTDTPESGSQIGCPAASMPRTPIRRRNLARERQIPSRCHRFPVSVNKYRPGVWRPDEDRRLCSGDSRIAPVGGPRRPVAAGACPDPNANSPRPRFPNRPWPVQWNSGGCPAVQYHRGEAAEDYGPGGQEALLRSSPTVPDRNTIPRRQFPGNFIPALGGT